MVDRPPDSSPPREAQCRLRSERPLGLQGLQISDQCIDEVVFRPFDGVGGERRRIGEELFPPNGHLSATVCRRERPPVDVLRESPAIERCAVLFPELAEVRRGSPQKGCRWASPLSLLPVAAMAIRGIEHLSKARLWRSRRRRHVLRLLVTRQSGRHETREADRQHNPSRSPRARVPSQNTVHLPAPWPLAADCVP